MPFTSPADDLHRAEVARRGRGPQHPRAAGDQNHVDHDADDATSLQLIADTMGVTKANVCYCFHTQVEILERAHRAARPGRPRPAPAVRRRPDPDQRAAFAVVDDLGPATRSLTHLPDDELRAVLGRLCLRIARV